MSSSTAEAQAPLVELREVTKSFGATRALDRVSFDVRAGEVHVLAGENGAGKSTLIRVLSGVITDFEGGLFVKGERVHFRDARDAARHGIATIHQELSLVGSMSVAENLALPRPGSMFGWARSADEVRAAEEILASMDLDVDPRALVETLPLSVQQLIEIARASLAMGPQVGVGPGATGRGGARTSRVLILDEPTSALSETEAERLLARVEQLAKGGAGIVYISHRMEESDRIAHRVTVLRDGRVVGSRPAKELPRGELVALMMGSEGSEDGFTARARDLGEGDGGARPPLLSVRELRASGVGASPLHGVSFSVDHGEIVGLAGLRGSGTSEVLAALFGAEGRDVRGSVTLDGAPFAIEGPARSIEQGLLFLANDRKKTVLPDLDVAANITLSSLADIAGHGVVSLAREEELAREMTARLRVAAPSLHAAASALSGGNQQKVALLRCLAAKPRVLLLDEPTRGVDIGAKAEIHRTLRALAGSGMGIVVVASELSELLGLCDRVVVLSRGRITATLEKKDLSAQTLRLALDAQVAPAAVTPQGSVAEGASGSVAEGASGSVAEGASGSAR